jgi:hypothetical protein
MWPGLRWDELLELGGRLGMRDAVMVSRWARRNA